MFQALGGKLGPFDSILSRDLIKRCRNNVKFSDETIQSCTHKSQLIGQMKYSRISVLPGVSIFRETATRPVFEFLCFSWTVPDLKFKSMAKAQLFGLTTTRKTFQTRWNDDFVENCHLERYYDRWMYFTVKDIGIYQISINAEEKRRLTPWFLSDPVLDSYWNQTHV